MRVRIGLCVFSFLVAACHRQGQEARLHIMGGRSLLPSDPGWIHTVGLATSSTGLPHCTGVLVGPDVVLTAAHCVVGRRELHVFFESEGSSSGFETRPVVEKRTFLDEERDIGLFRPGFDIAWVRFSGEKPIGYEPAELFSEASALRPGQPLELVGYGWTEGEKHPKQRSTVSTIVHGHVHEPHARHLVLFGKTPGRSSCYGDSGGPAFVRDADGRWKVAGITRGDGRGLDLFPDDWKYEDCSSGFGIYTAVDGYSDWLRKTAFEHGTHTFFAPRESSAPETFLQWCADPSPTRESFFTVSALMHMLGTVRCDVAAARAQEVESLSVQPSSWLSRVQVAIPEGASVRIKDFRPLSSFRRLRSLSLSEETPTSLDFLTPLVELRELQLNASALRDVSALNALVNLRELKLENPMGGLDELGPLPHLERLVVRRSPLRREEERALALPDLSRFPMLREVIIEGFSVNLKEALRETHGSLSSLVVSLGTLQGVDALGRLPRLEDLTLSALGLEDVRSLARLPGLRMLNLSRNEIRDVSALAALRGLQELDLRENPLPERECPVVERIYRVCRFDIHTDMKRPLAEDFSQTFRRLVSCQSPAGKTLSLRLNETRTEKISRKTGAPRFVLEGLGKDEAGASLLFVGVADAVESGAETERVSFEEGELHARRFQNVVKLSVRSLSLSEDSAGGLVLNPGSDDEVRFPACRWDGPRVSFAEFLR